MGKTSSCCTESRIPFSRTQRSNSCRLHDATPLHLSAKTSVTLTESCACCFGCFKYAWQCGAWLCSLKVDWFAMFRERWMMTSFFAATVLTNCEYHKICRKLRQKINAPVNRRNRAKSASGFQTKTSIDKEYDEGFLFRILMTPSCLTKLINKICRRMCCKEKFVLCHFASLSESDIWCPSSDDPQWNLKMSKDLCSWAVST